MGITNFIKDKRTYIKIRMEGIQKLKPQKTAKDFKLFTGVVNYLGIFCPN